MSELGLDPEAKAEAEEDLLFDNRNSDLDIRYSAHPHISARHSEGELVLSLKIRFCGI